MISSCAVSWGKDSTTSFPIASSFMAISIHIYFKVVLASVLVTFMKTLVSHYQNVNLNACFRVTQTIKIMLFPYFLLPVSQGAKLLLQIRISSEDMIRSISEVSFHDTFGREALFSGTVEPITGRTQGVYVANVTLPHKECSFHNSASHTLWASYILFLPFAEYLH